MRFVDLGKERYLSAMAATSTARVTLRYDVQPTRDDWVLPEEPVPESLPHSLTVDLIKALLLHWVARVRLDAQVAPNLAVRWVAERPKVGLDPDLCVITPRTPEGDDLDSLCTWKTGHSAPKLAVEVVSKGHPYKDYARAPEKYAASGTGELWVFDPLMVGPKALGGPLRLQVWVRAGDGAFERVYAGDGPAFSPTLNAWLFAVDEGRRLRIADDREGTLWWRTQAEEAYAARQAALAETAAALVEKEAALIEKEAAIVEKEAALGRIAELEAELRRRG